MIVKLRQGDTWPPVRISIYGPTRAVSGPENRELNLAGATVRFNLYSEMGEQVLEQVGSVDPKTGALEYKWRQGDTDRSGVFEGEFVIRYPRGEVQTVPSVDRGPIVVVIEARR
jgi:hypothetical protein